MTSPKLLRVVFFLLVGFLSPVFLTHCKTTPKSYKDVRYDPAKLKTPAGHGLERKDYPFDESGAYRKDWVKANATGRDRSASPQAETAPVLASASTGGSRSTPATATKPASSGYPTYEQASAARRAESTPAPAVENVMTLGTVGTVETVMVSDANLPAPEFLLASASLDPAPVPTPSPTVSAPAPATPRYHKVGSGDTLFGLAARYNTSVTELKRVNGLSGNTIRVGQSLRLP